MPKINNFGSNTPDKSLCIVLYHVVHWSVPSGTPRTLARLIYIDRLRGETMPSLQRLVQTIITVSLMTTLNGAHAETFPNKAIRFIVPQAAGSGNDVLARSLADELRKGFNQPIIIENKPGANGSLAANYVLSQPADGHTIFLAGVSNLSWNPYLYKKLSYVPSKDFAGVALIANTPFVTVVSPSLQVKNFAEFVKKAKEQPGQLNYASAGVGNSTHLASALIAERTGISIQHVPYNGAGAITSVIAGDPQMMTTVLGGIVSNIQAGKLVPLAVTGEKRLAGLPDVPTFKELGYDVQVPGWYSIVVKTGTPPAIIKQLNAEINKAIDSPAMKERLAAQSMDAIKGTPGDVEQYMKRDAEQWGPIIQKLNIAQ
jgi:tripartite-type tricarboxylate transporter receptor subunit TctC